MQTKYNIGDIVHSRLMGNTRLRIYDKPTWNNEYKQWLYPYEYGLGHCSEGSALECNLYLIQSISKN